MRLLAFLARYLLHHLFYALRVRWVVSHCKWIVVLWHLCLLGSQDDSMLLLACLHACLLALARLLACNCAHNCQNQQRAQEQQRGLTKTPSAKQQQQTSTRARFQAGTSSAKPFACDEMGQPAKSQLGLLAWMC